MTRREGLLTVVSGLSENEEIKIKNNAGLVRCFLLILQVKLAFRR